MSTPVVIPVSIESQLSPLTMSSRDIAELTAKSISSVHRDIANMFNQLEDDSNLDHLIERDFRGYIYQYHLPRRECEILITGYDVKRRAAVIDRFIELESGQAAPQTKTQLEMIAVMAVEAAKQERRQLALEEKQATLEAKLKEFSEAGAPPAGFLCLSDLAGLGLSAGKLKLVLRNSKYPVQKRNYRHMTPQGICVPGVAFHEEQAKQAVYTILAECSQVSEQYCEHPDIGRFKHIK